jgi:hypothetical protein
VQGLGAGLPADATLVAKAANSASPGTGSGAAERAGHWSADYMAFDLVHTTGPT